MSANKRPRPEPVWDLRLYVAGSTPRSVRAVANLKKLCEIHLQGRYKLTVVDLHQTPEAAQGAQIVALPTLIQQLPLPLRRVIGDLSNTQRVLLALDIQPETEPPCP